MCFAKSLFWEKLHWPCQICASFAWVWQMLPLLTKSTHLLPPFFGKNGTRLAKFLQAWQLMCRLKCQELCQHVIFLSILSWLCRYLHAYNFNGRFVLTSQSKPHQEVCRGFISTSMSRPKSLDRDREIRRDLKFSAFLDSLSRSRPRSAWIFVFSRRDFSIRRDFRPWQCRDFSTNLDRVSTNLDRVSTNLDCVSTNLENLDVSRQISTISTISTRLDNLDKNLDASKSRLKNLDFKNLDQEKKKVDLDRRENLDKF